MSSEDLRKSMPVDEALHIMELYDSIASSYDDLYADEQRSKYLSTYGIIRGGVSKVLDVGCGTAEYYLFICDKERESNSLLYIGVDVSLNMLAIAREKISLIQEGCQHIAELIAGDITAPPLRNDADFDLILIITVLRSVYNVETIIKYYSQNYLGRGGTLIFTVTWSGDEDEVYQCPEGSKLISNIRRNEVACVMFK